MTEYFWIISAFGWLLKRNHAYGHSGDRNML